MNGSTKAVLVVEDDADLRQTLTMVVKRGGYVVAEAGNGLEAQQYLQSAAVPCLILLDLMMPVMNGWDFLAWLESQQEPLSSVKVVIMSGAHHDTLETAMKAHKAVALIEKPVKLAELLNTVSQFC